MGDHNLVEILIRTYESCCLNTGEPQNLNTPLMLACVQHNKNVIERLLLAGANCNLQNKKGETALHILAKIKTQQNVELIKLIKPFSIPSLSITDLKGKTPFELSTDT
jgi:ankyrin repeat protein